MSPRILLPTTLALLAFSAGCEEVDPFLPKVSFERLDVDEIDWEHVDSDFVFKVSNPNPIQIKLARFDYSLAFVDIEWATGDDPDGLVLDASGGSEVALPVSIVFETLYEMVQATRGDDAIPFALSGSFGFDTSAGVVDLPYNAEGDFPALRTPTITYQDISLDDLGLTGATLGVNLDIDNDHGSNLVFQNFDYDLKLNGSALGSGLVDLLADVDGASTDSVTIPVEVEFAEVGAGIYDAIVDGSARLALSAGTDVETPFGVVPLTIDQSGNVSIQ